LTGPHAIPPATVVLFYASPSLGRQMAAWMAGRRNCAVVLSAARSASGVRKAVERARFVVVDASRNQGRAREAFSLALAQRGSDAVVVYTETAHAGLELFVRSRGGLFLLGPMPVAAWKELLRSKLGRGRAGHGEFTPRLFMGPGQTPHPSPRGPHRRRAVFSKPCHRTSGLKAK